MHVGFLLIDNHDPRESPISDYFNLRTTCKKVFPTREHNRKHT